MIQNDVFLKVRKVKTNKITNKKNKGDKEKEQDFNELTMSTEDF